MSENEPFDDLEARYVAEGITWTPLFQPKLFEIQTETPQFKGELDRSRKSFIEEDMLAAAMFLRHVFTPNHLLEENDALVEGVFWVQKNPEIFFHDGYYVSRKGRFRKDFPPFVGANHQSIHIILGGKTMFKIKEGSHEKLVTYTPNTKDWETDLKTTSLQELDKLLGQPYKEGKKIGKELYSTSGHNNILLKFFWSGGEIDREESIDTLTWRMLIHYHNILWQREIGRNRITKTSA